MLGLPVSTEFNRRIPKQKFYDNLTITPELKKMFVEQIESIYWTNKIAPSTLNISYGEEVAEIEVFHIQLNQNMISEKILQQIDKEIPYHILFLLEYECKYQLCIGYKEQSKSNSDTFKVNSYYYIEWQKPELSQIKIEGLNMDTVYHNFILQIAGDRIIKGKEDDIKQAYERTAEIVKIKKQVESLYGKVRNEKQFNRQVELNSRLKEYKKKLAELEGTI
jgi:hypothetical protein